MINHCFPASCPEIVKTPPGLLSMSARQRKSGSVKKSSKKEDDAFDIWLKRGLHQLFDDVAKEPIPEELLRLLDNSRDE